MSPVTLGLCLAAFSALTTAFAHASIKSGTDKLAVQAWVRLGGLTLASPIALWIGAPPGYLWPWLLVAAAVHAVYQGLLSFSYTISDFSISYPIARGISPILTAAIGVLFLGEIFNGWLLAAIVTVSIGIIMLAAGKRLTRTGLIAAIATGILTAGYSVIDAHGMRLSPDLLNFVVWFFVLDGIAMPLLFVVRRRASAPAILVADWRAGSAAAVMAPVSFVPALYAFMLAPVGAVAAIRETSVLIGMVVARRVLGESVDARRLIAAALITIGICGTIAASAHG